MIRPFIVASAVLGLALLAPSRPSAQAGNSSHDGQSFTAATTAILVDVVVRDRKGRPVTDLTGADFEVAEDGVPQKVDTFARVARGGGIGVGVGVEIPGRNRRRDADRQRNTFRVRTRAAGGRRDRARVRSSVVGHAQAGARRDAGLRPDERRVGCARCRVRDRSRDPHRAAVHDRPQSGAAKPSPEWCLRGRRRRSRRRSGPRTSMNRRRELQGAGRGRGRGCGRRAAVPHSPRTRPSSANAKPSCS